MNITELRAGIAALQEERAEHLDSGPSRAEMRANVHGFARMSESIGRHRLANGVAADDVRGALIVRPGPDGTVDLAPVLAAVLGAEAFAERLCEHLALVPVGVEAADKRKRIEAIDLELNHLEVAEEAEIMRLEADGQPVARRGNAKPEIVLAMLDAASDDAAMPAPLPTAGVRKSRDVPEPRPTRRASAYLNRGSE